MLLTEAVSACQHIVYPDSSIYSLNMTDAPYYVMAPNQLILPADSASVLVLISVVYISSSSLQILTDRELLSCHAEVKALQNKLGTSYKDASHRLYMAEVEKLKL